MKITIVTLRTNVDAVRLLSDIALASPVMRAQRARLSCWRIFDPTAAPLLASETADAKAQIGRRAYEMYERHGRNDGHAVQDWLEAERAIRSEQTRYSQSAQPKE